MKALIIATAAALLLLAAAACSAGTGEVSAQDPPPNTQPTLKPTPTPTPTPEPTPPPTPTLDQRIEWLRAFVVDLKAENDALRACVNAIARDLRSNYYTSTYYQGGHRHSSSSYYYTDDGEHTHGTDHNHRDLTYSC